MRTLLQWAIAIDSLQKRLFANALQTDGAERHGTRHHGTALQEFPDRAGRYLATLNYTSQQLSRRAFSPGVEGSSPSGPTISRAGGSIQWLPFAGPLGENVHCDCRFSAVPAP